MRCKNCLSIIEGQVCPVCGQVSSLFTDEMLDEMDQMEEELWLSLKNSKNKSGYTVSSAGTGQTSDAVETESARQSRAGTQFAKDIVFPNDELRTGDLPNMNAKPEPEAASETEAISVTETVSEPETMPKAETVSEEETVSEPEVMSEAEAVSKTETDAGQKSQRQSETKKSVKGLQPPQPKEKIKKFNFEAIFFAVVCAIIVLGCYSAMHYADNKAEVVVTEKNMLRYRLGRDDAVTVADQVRGVVAYDVKELRFLYVTTGNQLVLNESGKLTTLAEQVTSDEVWTDCNMTVCTYCKREGECYSLWVRRMCDSQSCAVEEGADYIGSVQVSENGRYVVYVAGENAGDYRICLIDCRDDDDSAADGLIPQVLVKSSDLPLVDSLSDNGEVTYHCFDGKNL